MQLQHAQSLELAQHHGEEEQANEQGPEEWGSQDPGVFDGAEEHEDGDDEGQPQDHVQALLHHPGHQQTTALPLDAVDEARCGHDGQDCEDERAREKEFDIKRGFPDSLCSLVVIVVAKARQSRGVYAYSTSTINVVFWLLHLVRCYGGEGGGEVEQPHHAVDDEQRQRVDDAADQVDGPDDLAPRGEIEAETSSEDGHFEI